MLVLKPRVNGKNSHDFYIGRLVSNQAKMNSETEQIFLLNPTASNSLTILQKADAFSETTQVNLENVEDFSNVCRTCATITEFVIPIFEGEGLQNNLADKIHKHLPIQVTEQDMLPRVVCYQCASTLLAWHELVQCCVQADTALRTRLAELESKPPAKCDTEDSLDKDQQIKDTHNDTLSLVTENNHTKPELLSSAVETKHPVTNKWSLHCDIEPEITENDNGEYVRCEVCDKSVPAASRRRHVRTHRDAARHRCHACGLGFSEAGNLARHARALHGQHRPHRCPACGRAFTRRCHLRDHLATHSAAREHVCDVCGKASKSAAALRMHRGRHGAARAHRCPCGAAFKRRGELAAHRSVHTGERAHLCPCGRAFRLRGQLAAHAKTHRVTTDRAASDRVTPDRTASDRVTPDRAAPTERPR